MQLPTEEPVSTRLIGGAGMRPGSSVNNIAREGARARERERRAKEFFAEEGNPVSTCLPGNILTLDRKIWVDETR